MHRTSSFSWQITALALITLGLGLLLLPEDLSELVRRSARDVSRPGQFVTRCFSDWAGAARQAISAWQARRSDVVRLSEELYQEREQNAESQRRLALLQQELNVSERKRNEKISASPSNTLFVPDLIEARVLGHETVALHAGRKILGVGSAKGIGENLLVVDVRYPTLDVGTDRAVSLHSPVFAGPSVVGRTLNCGAYSCSLQPVTDAKYSGPAQLMRRTASGLQPGPEGVVEGTGQKLCRLTGIWRREPVEVGDEIYTPADDPLVPYPMYYGKVVRAELPDGTAHWIIELEPAANEQRLKHVQVLRPKENPLRILAN
jgi:cell shape-determining protein MreC